jgi:hypothetical protein
MWDSPSKKRNSSVTSSKLSKTTPYGSYEINQSPQPPKYRATKTESSTKESYKMSPPEKTTSKEAMYGKPVEIIPDRLYWVADSKPPQNYKDAFFFNIDNVSSAYSCLTIGRTSYICRSIGTLVH